MARGHHVGAGAQRARPLRASCASCTKPPDGSVWFGTTTLGGGVLRPGASTLERFGPDDGYPELAVYALLAPRPRTASWPAGATSSPSARARPLDRPAARRSTPSAA